MLLIVGVCLWIHASQSVRYHGDERFYTDGAIQMLETGQYGVPRFADGSLRFHKPPLFYWAVALSFRMFGIGLTPSRLPSVFSVLVLCWIVHWWQRRWYPDLGPFPYAAWILAGNVAIWELGSRATPDALALLWVTVAWWGITEVLLGRATENLALWRAYGGAGMGALTKGLVGVVPIIWGIGASIWKRKPIRRLIRWGPLVIGGVLGVGWYAWVRAHYGAQALSSFMQDQVSGKIGVEGWRPWIYAIRYGLDLVRFSLPWVAIWLGLWGWAQRRGRGWEKPRDLRWLVWSWAGLWVGIFSLGSVYRSRYVAYVYPALALWLAVELVRGLKGKSLEAWQRVGRMVAWGLVGIGGIALGSAWIGKTVLWKAGLSFLLLGGVGLGLTRKQKNGRAALEMLWAWTALAVSGSIWIGEVAVRPWFVADPAAGVVKRVWEEMGDQGRRVELVGVGLRGRLLGKIRVLSGGRVWPLLEKEVDVENERRPVLFAEELWRERLERAGWRIELVGWWRIHWNGRAIWLALRKPTRAEAFRQYGKPLFLAWPPTEGEPRQEERKIPDSGQLNPRGN